MDSIATTTTMPSAPSDLPAALRWRCWPLMDHARWSWTVPLGILAIGAMVMSSGGWFTSAIAVAALTITMWQFFVPVAYEVDSLGIRRRWLGHAQLVPWHLVRAYQARPTGIVLFQRTDAIAIDSLRSIFLPYGADADESLCVVRQYLSHAVELPR